MATVRKDNNGRILKTNEYQRADGRYEYKYTEKYKVHSVYSWRLNDSDPTPIGRKPCKSLRTIEKEIQKSINNNYNYYDTSRLTLNSIVDRYLDSKINTRESTEQNYKYMYDRFVRNSLGRVKLCDLMYSDIKGHYTELIKKQLIKVATLDTLQNVIHPALTMAVRDRIIPNNPSDSVIGDIKKETDWSYPKKFGLSHQQQDALIDFVNSQPKYARWAATIGVLIGTGLRVSEFVGLCESNLDFENDVINVDHQLTYRKGKDGKCRFRVGPVKKKASNRSIPMLSDVKKLLLKLCDERTNNQVIDGTTGFIIQNRYGTVQNPKGINDALKRIVQDYNQQEQQKAKLENRKPLILPNITCHTFRHTFCVRLCEELDKIDVIQSIMGHSDIRTTLDIYNEVNKDRQKASMTLLEGKIRII